MDQVREAILEDAESIDNVLSEAWNQSIDREVFHSQLSSDTCGIWVATANGDVVGFVSAFMTFDLNNRGRWEIDLVAVRPASRRQGLGRRLVCRAWEETEGLRLDFSRAFVRVTNVESQRMFQQAGFVTDWRDHILHIWGPKASGGGIECSEDVNLVPVDTLTYRGLWIEGLTSGRLSESDQRRVIASAQHRIGLESRLNTGAFIPADELPGLAEDVRKQAIEHGKYHCWKRIRS